LTRNETISSVIKTIQISIIPVSVSEKILNSLAKSDTGSFIYLFIFIYFLLFICAYNAWVISFLCPHPSFTTHPPPPLPPTPSIPSRNYFALISNFVKERV
jgi:hypothetical protein